MFSPNDTIVAVATPPGRGGIGVVRISGARAREIAAALLAGPPALLPRHATLARVLDADGRGVDEVIATLFPAPSSYTTEDVVEIAAHGSPSLLRGIVDAAVGAGARLAEPGEFTLRAFLKGRLDLVQAEAVADLVDAVTPLQARVAFDQLEGTLTRAIGALDGELFELAARLEASLDFPEEGYHFVEAGETREALARIAGGLDGLLASAGEGRLIREGRRIAVLGKPNVGKSSLFNWLVGTDRAIVAETPGTTRDLVTETIDFDGIRLGLVDTAGLRVGEDAVEREGISRARAAAGVADLVLVVLDISRPFDADDRRVLEETAGARRVIVWNKRDLAEGRSLDGARSGESPEGRSPGPSPQVPSGQAPRVSSGQVGPGDLAADRRPDPARPGESPEGRSPGPSGPGDPPPVVVSLKTGEGLPGLRAAMKQALEFGAEPLRDAPMVTNQRHEAWLRQAQEALRRAIADLDERGGETPEELVLADMAAARLAFENVTGRRTTDDLLREIFSRFCIGK